MQSDTLFMADVTRDLFELGGQWRDWRMTPAPAYVPDVALYMLGYALFPFSVTLQIFFATASQAVLLTGVLLWLGKRIYPQISIDARTVIVLLVNFTVLTSCFSGLALLFNTANNHFPSFFFSLLCLVLLLKFLERPTLLMGALFVLCGAVAKISDSVFIICFTAPVAVTLGLAIFFAAKQSPLAPYRRRLLIALGLMPVIHLVAVIFDALVTFNDPFGDRLHLSFKAAANSFELFLEATAEAFAWNNKMTFSFSVLVVASFVFLIYRLVRKINLRALDQKGSVEFACKFASPPPMLPWTFFACGAFLLVLVPVNWSGAVFSGGFADLWAHRYFMVPMSLAVLLSVVIIDSNKNSFRKVTFSYGIPVLIVALLVGAVIGQIHLRHLDEKRTLSSIITHGVSFAAQDGMALQNENVAQCLVNLQKQGIDINAGVADYWYARGVTFFLPDRNRIEALRNETDPLFRFYMTTIGPLLHPEHYPPRKYNFAILHDSPDDPDPHKFLPENIGKLLPEGYAVYPCKKTNIQIWYYAGDQLNNFVQETHKLSLAREGYMQKDALFKAVELPADVGQPEGSSREAISPRDKAGSVAYGPYINLKQGHYKVTIRYKGQSADGKPVGDWDVGQFSESPDIILAKGDLTPTKNGVIENTISVQKSILDKVETRIRFNGNGSLTLESVDIAKL